MNDIYMKIQNIKSILADKQGEETLRIIKDYLEIKEKINSELKGYFVEVIHAKWTYGGYDYNDWVCSNCGHRKYECYYEKPKDKFCSECGAKMDLE